MSIQRPTHGEIANLARSFGFGLSDSEVEEYAGMIDEALRAHDWLQSVQWPGAEPSGSEGTRDPGRAPSPAENRLGAWYRKTRIAGAPDGPLSGKTVVVKDNICVARVAMACGSEALEGYVPERDATVVSRVLAAGAEVVGKAVCEPLSYSGGSHLSASGPVRNPHDLSRSSGGSSSGCAALLAAGEVDLAIGGDQGGSIRGPSSWSGTYGLKPTYGLVPYTGAFGIEMTLDHLGPMARSTADVALLLDVLAGPDGLDPRQQQVPVAGRTADPSYRTSLGEGASGLTIGVLGEGFGWDGLSEPDVETIVRAAAGQFGSLGAQVSDVSVPLHRVGGNVTAAIACEGATALLLHGEGFGTNWRGLYDESMLTALAAGRRAHGESLPATLKLHALAGQWMHDTTHGVFYAKAQNAARALASAYDEALDACDLLVMPTTPIKATLLPTRSLSIAETVALAHKMGVNTSPFNATGHPAMSVPCGMSEGLPVGLMIVGRRGADATVLRAAHAFETEIFGPPSAPLEVPA
jgi:amidase